MQHHIKIVRNVSFLAGFSTGVLRHCLSIPTVANHPADEIAVLNRREGLVSRRKKRHTKTRQNHIVISLRLNRTSFSVSLSLSTTTFLLLLLVPKHVVKDTLLAIRYQAISMRYLHP